MTASTAPSPLGRHAQYARKLAKHLQDAGARVEFDDAFERTYHLDFTLTRHEHLFAHVNLGVHLTTTPEQPQVLEAFTQTTKRGLVLKALYIELDEETLHAGGLLVAQAICMSFLFDRRWAQTRQLGVRIFEDCSFQWFDLDEALARQRRQHVDQDTQIGADMLGRIIAYFTDKGFGFIQTDDERKFFFHIANIVDDELRARLPSYIPGESIPAHFQYGGDDGKKYPKAINVALPRQLASSDTQAPT